MASDETARRHHAQLFGDDVSTLAQTDPELVDRFDDFAFDEVLTYSHLDVRTRLMVTLAALIAADARDEYRVMAGAALTVGVTPVELKEVVYQAVAYVGMGRAFGFLHVTNDVLTERGVELPLEGQATTTRETRFEVGLATQKRIVGDEAVEAMYANAPADAAHFQRFLSANCFGDHVARSGVDLPVRELLTFAMLVALGGADNQVAGHVAGNRNVGNTRADLLAVLTVLLPFVGYPRALNGLAAVNDGAPAES